MEDILNDDESSREYLDDILVQARSLPNHGWLQRLSDGMPHGAAERISLPRPPASLCRDPNSKTPFGLETEAAPPLPEIYSRIGAHGQFGALLQPAQVLWRLS